MVEILFWGCLALVVYTFVGYGILLRLVLAVKRLFTGRPQSPQPPAEGAWPEVTLLICAYNEEDIVAEKMANCRALRAGSNRRGDRRRGGRLKKAKR